MHRSLLLGLLVFSISCGSGGSREDPKRGDIKVSPAYSGNQALKTRDDLDVYNGKRITIYGTFDHIQGKHGVVRMENNLTINIPHFDVIARGKPWGEYVGKKVQVSGILHSYPKPAPIPGYRAPTLQMTSFRDFSVVGN